MDQFQVDEALEALQTYLSLGGLPSSTTTGVSAAAPKKKNEKKSATTSDKYDRWTLKDPSTIDYGYLAQTKGEGIQDADSGFYITTAINYTNGPAHMGHAYEAATSDVIARYQRLKNGGPVFFLTGSDEHGQKIANTAADQGKQPIDICDLYVKGFQVLNQRLLITNDDYLRTTSARHKACAHEVWRRCNAAGDVYLDQYSGWYNIREETFVTDNDAALSDYKDPTSGAPLKKVQEESYFFKMSKYKDRLIAHLQEHPDFIQPQQHYNLILQRLQADELRDLSISRTTFSWGIPVPDGFDAKHVMYVWVDALSNYLTGVDGVGTTALSKFWPANVHVIGKDILWFHTVIWPCLLMSAGIALPKSVFAHGFVNDSQGKKMSKSLGNVVDPHDMLDKYHVDTFRWYLCKEASFGGELAFSEASLRDMHNADLCNTLGNLVNRATSLCQKICGGVVPDVPAAQNAAVADLADVIRSYNAKMNSYELQQGAMIAIAAFSQVNGYLQEQAPWNKKGDEHATERQVIVRATLEAIYALSHLLLPFLPVGCKAIFEKLNTPPKASLAELDASCRNLETGTKIDVGQVLYERALSPEEQTDTAEAKESHAQAQRRKKELKAQNVAKSKAGAAEAENQSDFSKMDIRVGTIIKVWNHEQADKLYCEQIDVGEDKPREIASGLRPFYTLEQMQNAKVLVVCNLKAVKMVGFSSEGMVLAAKSADGATVELVTPPADANNGERIVIEGQADESTPEPFSATQVKKKKVWETVAADLKTSDGGVATWKNQILTTSAGPCKAATLVGAAIS